MKLFTAKPGEGYSPYTCTAALAQGSTATRLSALIMGFGSFACGQAV